jgi:tripartite-type tricarboxylate transporter receptor subunit TctC
MTNWTAMMTNAAVPAPILAKLEADTLSAIRDPEVSRRARDGGFTVEAWDRARSAAYINAETDRWARLVQEAKLKAD